MFHRSRVWSITTVDDAIALAEKLKTMTWTCCQGFRYRGTLWLNDSITEDSVQEYGVVREADLTQIESITVSWCSTEHLLAYIEGYADGTFEPFLSRQLQPAQIQEAATHGRCRFCA